MSVIGVVGLAVMGQNLALNIAEKGFKCSVFNRTVSKVDETVERAKKEGVSNNIVGTKSVEEFVKSLQKPRKVIILVKAGKPVDETIEHLTQFMEKGDIIIDGGNEWYKNTEQRAKRVEPKGLLYFGMGVSGGEEGARHGPSLMPGGPKEAYSALEPIITKVAAQVDGSPCVTYIGPGGSGNYVKMIHNGIEYGDMELISEIYDLLKNLSKLSNPEIADVFAEWNSSELKSFLIEITHKIFQKRNDLHSKGESDYLIDYVVDMSGSKGTGKWTVQEAAERGIAAPTIASALDSRYLSSLKHERVLASKQLSGPTSTPASSSNTKELIQDLKNALYCSKICSYAQGMNIIRQASKEFEWNLKLGEIAKIWKGGCIIRAIFLDRIKSAYDKDADLPSLLLDEEFKQEINQRQESWRRVCTLAIQHGIPVPALSGSLAYYDTFRREKLPANLIQAQRDLFGAHTYQRTDDFPSDNNYHSEWSNSTSKEPPVVSKGAPSH